MVKKSIDSFPPGIVFDYSVFPLQGKEFSALAKSLSRLTIEGQIVRLSRGKYYKPQKSVFGNLQPDENQVVRSLTKVGDKTIGYLTGLAAFNSISLTSQVSNSLTIARRSNQQAKEFQGYRIKFVKRNFQFSAEEVKLLQILDAMRSIKSIPDATVNESLSILSYNVKKLESRDLRKIIRLSFNYPPSTRALLGAIIEYQFSEISVVSLYKSLNPLSKYRFGIDPELLPNKSKWNIQ